VKRWKDAVETDFGNEAEYIDHFPLWIKIWEASIVLCEYLTQLNLDLNAHILELGAGAGLTGMMLGRMGHPMTITDYDDHALALLQKNVKHNKLKNVRVNKLDWFQSEVDETYDIIIGSELIYKEELIQPLLDLFLKCLKPEGKIFIAHDRVRRNMLPFLEKAEQYFQVHSTAKKLNTNDKQYRIAIHTLQFK